MKIVVIQGPVATGKTTMLRASFKEAGPDASMFTSAEFQNGLKLVESSLLGLPKSTFVDDLPKALLPRVKKLSKLYDDEYVLTVVVEAD